MSSDLLTRLDVRSIGTASPHDAASVALGLGVSVPEMVSAFYQAPTTITDGLPEPTAVGVAELLRSLGCVVDVVDSNAPPPDAGTLFDVAVIITDEERFEAIAGAAAEFLGCSADEARRLLLDSPPVLVGQVSTATVSALRERLGEGADVITSDPTTARYDLLLGEVSATVRSRLVSALRAGGFDPSAAGPWLLRGMTKDQADGVWTVHRHLPGLRLANQDFYRFEVLLDAGRPGEAATAALTAAGIPTAVVPRLFDALPIIVADGLTDAEAMSLIASLVDAGLEVHAELATFLQLGVHVTGWSAPPSARAALQAAGITDPPAAPPFTVGPWPELTARLVRSMLTRSGAEADLADAELIDAGARP